MVLPEAFAPALWAATLRTLRELTRLAVTALVLVVGFGGVAASSTVDAVRPVTVPEFRPVGSPVTALPARPGIPTSSVAGVGSTVAGMAPATDRATDADHAPASGIRTERPDRREAGQRPPARTVVVPAEPGRDAVARRGPPPA